MSPWMPAAADESLPPMLRAMHLDELGVMMCCQLQYGDNNLPLVLTEVDLVFIPNIYFGKV